MSAEYEIVKYGPDFKSQVIELQTHLWSPDPAWNAAYLEWKYERNPYIDRPLIYLVLFGGEVVGMSGMYGARWQVGHPLQTFLGLCVADSVTAPEHRNRGLFTKTIRAALDDLAHSGVTYVLNLSASKVTYLAYLTMGWRRAGHLQTMHRINREGDSLRRARRYASRLPFFASAEKPFDLLDKKYGRHRHETSTHISLEQAPRPQAMAELVERIGSDGRICHVRDQQYFSWRFQNPRSQYRFLFWEDARLEGYLVLCRLIQADRPAVSIVDWEATNAQVRAELLEAVIRWGNFQWLLIWSATLPD